MPSFNHGLCFQTKGAINVVNGYTQAEDPGELEKLPLIGSLFKKKEQPERLLQLWVTCTLGMLRDGNSKT